MERGRKLSLAVALDKIKHVLRCQPQFQQAVKAEAEAKAITSLCDPPLSFAQLLPPPLPGSLTAGHFVKQPAEGPDADAEADADSPRSSPSKPDRDSQPLTQAQAMTAPLMFASPQQIVDALWNSPQSLVNSLIQCLDVHLDKFDVIETAALFEIQLLCSTSLPADELHRLPSLLMVRGSLFICSHSQSCRLFAISCVA